MKDYKILFTGTPGAGKTTAIAAVSDVRPVVMDVKNTDASLGKERTTVGMDHGEFGIDGGDRIMLVGTPGQVRFDFMWRILAKNALGIIVLIDNSRPDPLADLAVYLNAFEGDLLHVACTIGVGRMQENEGVQLDAYCDALEARGLMFPVLAVDVREREDVVMLIDTILVQLEN